MKTSGIVSRVMAASSLLIGPFSDTASTQASAATPLGIGAQSLVSGGAQHVESIFTSVSQLAARIGLGGDAWAMVGIVAILLAYRLVRKHQALYPMTVARPGLAPRMRHQAATPAGQVAAVSATQSALTLPH